MGAAIGPATFGRPRRTDGFDLEKERPPIDRGRSFIPPLVERRRRKNNGAGFALLYRLVIRIGCNLRSLALRHTGLNRRGHTIAGGYELVEFIHVDVHDGRSE
jgi:hypothetical protein